MKKSRYQFFEQIDEDKYLHYSSLSNSFLLLKKSLHEQFENAQNPEELPEALKTSALNGSFFIDDDYDEVTETLALRESWADNDAMYQIVINPTLDCNLSCWYCYENRIAGSKISQELIDAIKKHIEVVFSEKHFSLLKVSFFGGEPFLCFDAIKEILMYSKEFCERNNINLLSDFTTNATLIDEEVVDFLSDYRANFQITLDGNEKQHNKIKKDCAKKINTYQKTIEALRLISERIPNHYLAVRLNFDNRTLECIDEILNQIDFIDRQKSCFILKKVWQLPTEKVNKELMIEALQKILDHRFLADYYLMPRGYVCFAERKNQVLFNYDGGIFKCTTLADFNPKNSLGEFSTSDGRVNWDKDRLQSLYGQKQREYCINCKWFPACMGPCSPQIHAHKDQNICTFDAMNLTDAEYLMYILKYFNLYKELFGIKKNDIPEQNSAQ